MSSDNSPASYIVPGPRRIYDVVRWLVALVAIVLLAILIISYLGRYWHFAELVCNFRLHVTLGLVAAIIVMLVLRFRWLPIVLFTIASFSLCQFSYDYWKPERPAAGNETHSIMSFNVLGTNRNVEQVLALIRQADPDVLVVIEYANAWAFDLEAIHDEYPHRILRPRWHGFGIALFSKHPFAKSEVVQLARDKTDSPMVIAEVLFDDKPVRIAAAHLLAPMDPFKMGIRTQEMQEIPEFLPYSNVPTVLIGDFNCVPWSPFLAELLRTTHLRDSRRGFGFQASWPANSWVMRIPIDHAFVSRQVYVENRKLLNANGSDHLPLFLEFSIGAPQAISDRAPALNRESK